VNALDRARQEKSWATRVLERRQEIRLSQQKVAELAGITQQALSSIERGKAVPRFLTMDALARALGTSVEQLFPIESRPKVAS
jgi:transcriptional regulator with XRE-family HTH domain